MRNGIIINGVAYEAHKRRIDPVLPTNPCKLCDFKRRCGVELTICDKFRDNNHEVYFKKVKEEQK